MVLLVCFGLNVQSTGLTNDRYTENYAADPNSRFWPICDRRTQRPRPALSNLYLRLFGYLQGIVDVNPQIPDSALKLGVPKKQLNGPKVPSSSVDQRRFGVSK